MTQPEGGPEAHPTSENDPSRPAGAASWFTETHADLGSALEQLSQVAVGTRSLESSLDRVAALTVRAIPGADGAGVTMLEAGRSATICASDQFVREVDDVQYGLSEGPCVTAMSEGRTVLAGSLGTDPSWPRFGPRARALGVHSALSLPLVMPDGEVMGALNVYGHPPDAFPEDAPHRGEVFAMAAAVVVNNARELMQARRLAEQLRAAMNSRATIDQAIGILMSRQGGNPDDAFATLKRLSQNQNIKLALVAEEIVREAVTRARARHGGAANG